MVVGVRIKDPRRDLVARAEVAVKVVPLRLGAIKKGSNTHNECGLATAAIASVR